MEIFDVVALKQDLTEHGLLRGSIGTIVGLLDGGSAFEVEFCQDGKTIISLGLREDKILPLKDGIRAIFEYFQGIMFPAVYEVVENINGAFAEVANLLIPVFNTWSRYITRERTLQLWRERCHNSKVKVRDHHMLRRHSTSPGDGGKRAAQ
jgi:hypothetical protein